jgi:hypothetical protein
VDVLDHVVVVELEQRPPLGLARSPITTVPSAATCEL